MTKGAVAHLLLAACVAGLLALAGCGSEGGLLPPPPPAAPIESASPPPPASAPVPEPLPAEEIAVPEPPAPAEPAPAPQPPLAHRSVWKLSIRRGRIATGRFRTIPLGRNDQVFDSFPPGPLELECREWPEKSRPSESAVIDVVDPDGLWVSDMCNTVSGQSRRLSEDNFFTDAEPIDLTVEWLRELGVFDETVTVEPAGYPDALYPRFRAVRDGKIIAIVTVTRLQRELDAPPDFPVFYFADGYQECDGPTA